MQGQNTRCACAKIGQEWIVTTSETKVKTLGFLQSLAIKDESSPMTSSKDAAETRVLQPSDLCKCNPRQVSEHAITSLSAGPRTPGPEVSEPHTHFINQEYVFEQGGSVECARLFICLLVFVCFGSWSVQGFDKCSGLQTRLLQFLRHRLS